MTQDLTNQRFGHLVAIEPTSKRVRNGVVWKCKCDCGNIVEIDAGSLKWHRKYCGRECKLRYQDLTNQRFGKLTVLSFIGRDKEGRPVWSCKCDCGKTTTASSNSLLHGHKKSCGCLRSENSGDGGESLRIWHKIGYVDGTCPANLVEKRSINNTSGIKGVSFQKSTKKWRAYITLNHKQKHLGLFNTLQEAAKARREAEQELFDPILKRHGLEITDEKEYENQLKSAIQNQDGKE